MRKMKIRKYFNNLTPEESLSLCISNVDIFQNMDEWPGIVVYVVILALSYNLALSHNNNDTQESR